MKHVTLALFLCITLFSCQKKESILETEKMALNSVFNKAVDSVYLKLTGNRTIANSVKKKIIVVYDSLTIDQPSYPEFKVRFQEVKNLYFDTISAKVTPKIELLELQKTANFKYQYKLSISKDTIAKNSWNSKHAIAGILLFSKIIFDVEKKCGAFHCTYINRDMHRTKHFLIYIVKENDKWKLKEVMLQNILL